MSLCQIDMNLHHILYLYIGVLYTFTPKYICVAFTCHVFSVKSAYDFAKSRGDTSYPTLPIFLSDTNEMLIIVMFCVRLKGRHSRLTERHNDARAADLSFHACFVFSGRPFLDNSYESLANYSTPDFLCDPCVFSLLFLRQLVGTKRQIKTVKITFKILGGS